MVETQDLTLKEIVEFPKDHEMVLEGRRMQQAFDALLATEDFTRSFTDQKVHAMEIAKRLRLVTPGIRKLQESNWVVLLGYAVGRLWFVEL